MPISWKGTLAQYAGRLHRLHDDKSEVIIYDYADLHVPMLARMHARRLKGYEAIGYRMEHSGSGPGPGTNHARGADPGSTAEG